MTKSRIDQATICFSDLNPKKIHEFDFRPSDEVVGDLMRDLELLSLSKLRLQGRLFALGWRSWVLSAHLGATVVQHCVVSLDPVSTRIDAPVERKFVPLAEIEPIQVSEDEEIEMDQDDIIEPLEAELDLLTILSESLALELPAYPRSKGAVLKTAMFSAAGLAPMSDEDAKPFAELAAFKAKLEK